MSQTILDEIVLAFVLWLVAIPLLALRCHERRSQHGKGLRLAFARLQAPLLWVALVVGALGAGALVGERKGVAVAAVGLVFATLGLVALLAGERQATSGRDVPPPE